MGAGNITVELAWPPRQLSPNGRFHHMEVYRFKKAAKDTAYWVTKETLGRQTCEHNGTVAVRIIAHPIKGKAQPDADNLMACMKGALDGIALALGIDDKHFAPSVEFAEPVTGGRVTVTIGAEK